MGRFIFYAVIAWVVFRWLDMMFGGRRRNQKPPFGGSTSQDTPTQDPSDTKKPNSDKIGDYVDFEEVDD
jgi:hypothetical protein